MKQNKVRKPIQPIADDAAPKKRKGRKPLRFVAKGDVVIPKKGMWAGEECLVLDVEKRPQPSGYYQVVRVLLPNQRQRLYPLTEIKEIIPGKGAIPRKARQQKSDAMVPNEKLNMQVVLEPLSGTVKENLDRAKAEVNRVLNFRGSVTGVKAEGTRIIVEFEINPKWD
ncbi:MAG: hypothetical protein NTV15_08970, partial [Candidatus Bathyarchaeota archaeon]|nr:hypothetical protein [Candidatus Bathyarchaeota archaeon]